MTPAAVYCRMSTDDQKTSIEIQRTEILRRFSDQYQIVGWYVDEGKSGSHSVEKRTEFLRLLGDAEKRQFEVVLCYDLSRFSRLDNIESAFTKQTLRNNGIRLHTIIEGEIDWSSSTGRIVDAVLTEGQHEYSVKLSRRVADGKKAAFERRDGVPGQLTPYGLARLVTDPQGNQRTVPRTEQFQRPKGWKQMFIPGDPQELEVVRWIFTEFGNRDVSFHGLATELNKKDVPSPTGRTWIYQTVHDILINVRYAGDLSFGRWASGKFHRIIDGEVQQNNDRREHSRAKKGFLVQKNTHEPVIDRNLFDAVQEKVKRRWRSGRHASGDFALTGVLFCGHCGKPLYGNERSGSTKHRKGVKYSCKGVHRGGSTGCGQWGVREEEVMPFLIRTLLKQIDRDEIRAVSIRPRKISADTTPLRRKLAKLETEYDQGMKRFLSLGNSPIANDMQDRLEKLKAEIVSLEQEIAKREVPDKDWTQAFARHRQQLDELRGKLIWIETWKSRNGAIGTGFTVKRQALREMFHQLRIKMELWFEKASDHRYRVARGRLRAGGKTLVWEGEPTEFDGSVEAGLVGGGSTPSPGEISLAHHGVLFLDELPEFNRRTLEVLRQPLEAGNVTISRAMGSVTFPANLMLVAALNPCPCGYRGDPRHRCNCNPMQVERYMGKISGPLLDRIDIHLEVASVPFRELSDKQSGTNSAQMRSQVVAARERQRARFDGERTTLNGRMTPRQIRRHCRLDASAEALLKSAMEEMGLSARAHDKILRVARTIADLDSCTEITSTHLNEAINYRTLDRNFRV